MTIARTNDYSDFDLAFRSNAVTSDLTLKKGAESVKQSVLNILLTNAGERPFMPIFGGNVRSFLFENFDGVTEDIIEENIRKSTERIRARL